MLKLRNSTVLVCLIPGGGGGGEGAQVRMVHD